MTRLASSSWARKPLAYSFLSPDPSLRNLIFLPVDKYKRPASISKYTGVVMIAVGVMSCSEIRFFVSMMTLKSVTEPIFTPLKVTGAPMAMPFSEPSK